MKDIEGSDLGRKRARGVGIGCAEISEERQAEAGSEVRGLEPLPPNDITALAM
jgi:hypothetical protein